jgi:Rps23 Pro-64 3,4-dihydroxylase Tpa1-like proline 4-hydroxylase
MLHLSRIDGYLALNVDECREFGRSLAERYQTSLPFPHVVIDDFLDREILRNVAAGFPSTENKSFFDREQERLKFQFQPHESSSAVVRNLFAELNSQAFLGFLEELTGIEGLISDPYFEGGGLHETKRGGHLGVHADFNVHGRLNVERKLNLLVYLNDQWRDEYGGDLELWDKAMKECVVRVKPVFGRAVIFNTALDSYHGHPDPLNCPPERSRRSLATYYYSASADGIALLPKRTTNFRPRPGSSDKQDWQVRRHHLINDWVPPKLQRMVRRLIG